MLSVNNFLSLFGLSSSTKEPVLLSDTNPYPDAHGREYISMSAEDKLDQLWE